MRGEGEGVSRLTLSFLTFESEQMDLLSPRKRHWRKTGIGGRLGLEEGVDVSLHHAELCVRHTRGTVSRLLDVWAWSCG